MPVKPESPASTPAPAAGPGREELVRDLAILRGEAPPSPRPRRPRRRRILGFALVVALFTGAAAFVVQWVWLRPPAVDLVAVTRRDVGVPPVVLTASGYLEARRQITLSSKAQGKIIEMPVEENDRVKTGDLIARLESDEQQASFALADAEYADAARELARQRSLRAKGSVSQSAVDSAETTFRVASARRDLAQVLLDNTILRAPIDGTVIRKIRDVGEFLTIGVSAEGDPGTAVVTLADLGAIDVALEIGETEIRKVEMGAPALVTPEAMPERHYLADVIEIAAMADRQKGVVPVKVRIREPDRDLLPDMTAKVRFLERVPAAPIRVADALPASAVVTRDGGAVVFVARDDVVLAVPVRTRPIDEDMVELVEGPELGTAVIEAPPPQLRSGDRIRVATP